MENLKEIQIKIWILLMCKLNKEYRGISSTELLQKRPKEIEGYSEIFNLLQNMKKEGLITEDVITESKNLLPPLYNISEKGQKFLSKVPRNEIIKIFNITPPEYSLKRRIEKIEYATFYGLISFIFFMAAKTFINYVYVPMISYLLFYIFFIGSVSYLTVVIETPLANIIKAWSGKTVSILDRRVKGLSLLVFLLLLVIILSIAYIMYPESFIENVWWIGIASIISGVSFSKNPLKNGIEKTLLKLRDHLKS